MMETLNSYFNVILQERFWSWSVIGIIYLVFAFTVRGWFLNPAFRQAKELSSKYYHEVKQDYLKYSFWGWFFFFLPLLFLTYAWNQTAEAPVLVQHQAALLLAFLSFFWSVLIHMRAFSRACLRAAAGLISEKESQTAIKHI